MNDGRCVAFTGGGTGGHVYPGLAVAEELRSRFAGRLVWIGSGKPVERAAVEAAGLEFFAVPSGKLRRSFSLENLSDAFKVLAGIAAARRVLRETRPALLFSKGGYVSVAPCLAAASLGIPVFTHESDASPGLATRINARRAERVYLGYESARERFPAALRDRVRFSGNPLRAGIASGDAARGRAFLGFDGSLPVVLVLGGSQGARSLNALVEAVLPALAGRAAVAHQTGPGNAPARAADREYRGCEFIRGELPDVLAAADVVVGRAGAATVSESAANGKPLVLVPLCGASTRGDQVENAAQIAAAGGAVSLVGDEATPESLLAALGPLLADPALRARMGAVARSLFPTDAAAVIAADIAARLGGAP